MFRRNRACPLDGPAAGEDQGQADTGAGQGVPQGRDHDPGRRGRVLFRHPSRRDTVPAAGQHRAVGARRPLRRAMADDDENPVPAAGTPQARPRKLAYDPFRRRLRRHGARGTPARRGAARRSRWRAVRAGAAAGTGEDPRGPHRRGLRLPQHHHPPHAETGNEQALRLHQACQEGHPGSQGQGFGENVQVNPAPGTGGAHREHQRHPDRVGELPPARSVQGRLQRCRPPCVEPHHAPGIRQSRGWCSAW